jgi:hypothetical protein
MHSLLGTPAEEGGGGKVKLVEAGAYDGLDCSLMAHPGNSGYAAWGRTLASWRGNVTWTGGMHSLYIFKPRAPCSPLHLISCLPCCRSPLGRPQCPRWLCFRLHYGRSVPSAAAALGQDPPRRHSRCCRGQHHSRLCRERLGCARQPEVRDSLSLARPYPLTSPRPRRDAVLNQVISIIEASASATNTSVEIVQFQDYWDQHPQLPARRDLLPAPDAVL